MRSPVKSCRQLTAYYTLCLNYWTDLQTFNILVVSQYPCNHQPLRLSPLFLIIHNMQINVFRVNIWLQCQLSEVWAFIRARVTDPARAPRRYFRAGYATHVDSPAIYVQTTRYSWFFTRSQFDERRSIASVLSTLIYGPPRRVSPVYSATLVKTGLHPSILFKWVSNVITSYP